VHAKPNIRLQNAIKSNAVRPDVVKSDAPVPLVICNPAAAKRRTSRAKSRASGDRGEGEDVSFLPAPAATPSSRDQSPDSYTEPARLASDANPKAGLSEGPADDKTRAQVDWILVDPQNEYDSIISDIAAKRATFV